MDMEGILAIIALFIVIPGAFFAYLNARNKRAKEVEKLKYQKEILELEIEKENVRIKLLEEENKKLDKIIYEK